MYTWPQILMIW